MANMSYKNQLALLISVIPEVAKENCFALHGGTAINLFYNDMPRLSVDIDLTYVFLEDRKTALTNINSALERIKQSIERILRHVKVEHKEEVSKLLISTNNAKIKIEVNETKRGLIEESETRVLCDKAQEVFDSFCAIEVVDKGQLYGGKICAALDRQHPRDLFDMKHFLENTALDKNIMKGFIYNLVGSDRPMNEIIRPNLLDQKHVMLSQFEGMSEIDFTYADFEETRLRLIEEVNSGLSTTDKDFLISMKMGEPDWSIYDFKDYPSVQWKLMNIQKLKTKNPDKHKENVDQLKKKLEE